MTARKLELSSKKAMTPQPGFPQMLATSTETSGIDDEETSVVPAPKMAAGDADRRPASPVPAMRDAADFDEGLFEVGLWLRASRDYRFTTVTPETHRRMLAKMPRGEARDLRDVFGWSLPFRPSLVPRSLLDWLDLAGVLETEGELLRSKVRYSTLDDLLLVHSAYPTTDREAVFFGPDTYRYAALIKQVLATAPERTVRHLVDVGAGTGVGGMVAARVLGQPELRVSLTDINPLARRYAAVNCELAGIAAQALQGDLLAPIEGPIDLVLSNPPYIADDAQRRYRDGGGVHGCELSIRVVREALQHLAPGGRLVLYTGAPVIDGDDVLFAALKPLLEEAQAAYDYRELDPDVFGEELERPAYAEVERIAAVGLIAQRPD